MENWKEKDLAETYLSGVRAAIPLAKEQLEIILRVINHYKPDYNSVLDLGCGDGILGKTLLLEKKNSRGLFLDFSAPMIEAAKNNLREISGRTDFYNGDLGSKSWADLLREKLPVDIVISGFAIHHLPDDVKKEIYHTIFKKVLSPGGIFINLEQVKSSSGENENIFNSYFLDKMKTFVSSGNTGIDFAVIEKEFYKDKLVNKLAPVEEQTNWLREIGFQNVDIFFKVFEITIFGGVKPAL